MKRTTPQRHPIAMATLMLLTLAAGLPAEQAPVPAPTAVDADMQTTIPLKLNNMGIDQLVKFLSDTTGKPIIKQKDVQGQITVSSPTPVTRRHALNLIYEALVLEGIYILEMDDRLMIVKAEAVRNMEVPTHDDSVDIQQLPDSPRVAQKIYKLSNISGEDIGKHLQQIVPESSITIDENSNTLILTDQIQRLKRYDRIVSALDQRDTTETVFEIFRLDHADAFEMAQLIGRILTPLEDLEEQQKYGRGRYSQRGFGTGLAESITVGDVTLTADPRTNWLICTCPPEELPRIRDMVESFDTEHEEDMQPRIVPIKYIDPDLIAQTVTRLFAERRRTAEKDEIRVLAADDGNKLVVYSSLENYERIQSLVDQLDTPDAEERETRTYTVTHIEVGDLADQLTQLYEERQARPWWARGGQDDTQASFVPSPRTNSLLVMARPRDFDFIERMIEELDVPIDAEAFVPRIYRIHHTDANELVNILETLFSEDPRAGRSNAYYFFRWATRGGRGTSNTIEELFGELRFVVDNVTNTIVVLASNPQNYEIIDNLIRELDQVDPEATKVLVHKLEYADALDVADKINNLFSEGLIQQQPEPRQQQQQQQQFNDDTRGTSNQRDLRADRRAIRYPWQIARRDRNSAEERPINTIIGHVRVVPDERSNKLLVAAPAIYFDALRDLIEEMDQPEPQVFIETRIVEVRTDNEDRRGIRWTPDPTSVDPAELDNALFSLSKLGFLDAGGGTGQPFGVTNDARTGSPLAYTATTGDGNVLLGADLNMALLMQLLVKNTDARIISQPTITVNNNEIGNVFVGSELPFRESTLTTDRGSQNVGTEYRPVGLALDLMPAINQNGDIVMTVVLENSKVREGELIDGLIFYDVTSFETQMAIDSMETMVIGGILVEDTSKIVRRVPILGSIPLLNFFFKKTDEVETVRELVVFITPTVLSNAADQRTIVEDARSRLDTRTREEREAEERAAEQAAEEEEQ